MFVDKIECNSFKGFDSVVVNVDNSTFIVGRNGQGKSNLLNAITWTLMGLDLYGNKLEPFKYGGPDTCWVKLDVVDSGSNKSIRRLVKVNVKGKTETIVNETFDIDKDIFYALVNPRFIIDTLGPKDIKNLVAKVVNIPTSSLTVPPNLIEAVESCEGINSYDKILAVENSIKTFNASIKDFEKEIIGENGKIEGVKNVKSLFAENAIIPELDVLTVLDMTEDEANSKIKLAEKEIAHLKEVIKDYNAYRTEAYEVLATHFNAKMKNVKIKLDENGKEVFIITYDGKNVRTCSNSEQLKAGLEIVNTISAFTGLAYPCLVDNAECAINIDIDEYPNIQQFIFALVADENLSTWDGDVLSDIATGTLMPRTKKQLFPTIKLLSGWGSK